MKKIREVLLDIHAVLLRKRNVAIEVKNGMTYLEDSLDVIDSMWKFCKVSMSRLGVASAQTQVTFNAHE